MRFLWGIGARFRPAKCCMLHPRVAAVMSPSETLWGMNIHIREEVFMWGIEGDSEVLEVCVFVCWPFVAKDDHAIRDDMTWLALDVVLSEGGLFRSPASLFLQNHLSPVTRYSSAWVEMTQDEAIAVKWLAQGHTASECQWSEVRCELRSSWILHWCSIYWTSR